MCSDGKEEQHESQLPDLKVKTFSSSKVDTDLLPANAANPMPLRHGIQDITQTTGSISSTPSVLRIPYSGRHPDEYIPTSLQGAVVVTER